jgi:cytochrome c-type biogenesis protein CcmH/NrfG
MAKNEKQAATQAPAKSPANLVVVGAACLAMGLAIGYYFGRQFAAPSAPADAAAAAQAPAAGSGSQTPLVDPAVFQENERRLKSALAADPKDANVLVQLGNLYYDSNRFGEAVDYYGRALELNPRNVDVRTDRGTSYWNLGQADNAIAEFQKALEVDPSHAQTLYNLGVVYMSGKNNPAEARKAWEKLLATNPNYPERARVQEQIKALGAAPGMPPSSGAGKKDDTRGVEDLLQRMKSRQ